MSVTSVMQEYLAEIYRIASYQDREYVSTSELAQRMNKTAPAIVRMASRLKEHSPSLIEHEPYKGITLTEYGEQQALLNIRNHRILEAFLVKVMGFGWYVVHAETDKLAGAVSDTLLERMNEMAEFPKRCPHGEPIPNIDGVMPYLKDVNLTDLDPPQTLTISRINSHDPEKLRYLAEIDLVPGRDIELISRAPFNGPLRLKIGRNEQVVGSELAESLRVCEQGHYDISYSSDADVISMN